MELIEIQKSILIEELNFQRTKHSLETQLLELDLVIKRQKLDSDEKKC